MIRKRLGLGQRCIIGIAFLLYTVQAFAAAQLQSVNYKSLANDQIQVTFNFSAPVGLPKNFSTVSPPRIVMDFFNVSNSVKQNDISIEKGPLTSINLATAGNRVRAMVNLEKTTNYQITQKDKDVILTLKTAGLTKQASTVNQAKFKSAVSSKGGAHKVEGFDFKRNASGGGEVVIALSDADMGVNVEQVADKIKINFLNTALPANLQRTFDVTDFGTPVQTVVTSSDGNDSEVLISAKGDYSHNAYQVNDKFVVDINPYTPEEKLKLQANQPKYTGNKLSLNFQNISIRAVLQLLADFTGQNIVASDTVTGDITLRLNDVPWDEALDIILTTQGLAKKQMGNVLLIAPAAEIAAREKQILQNQQQVQDLEPLVTQTVRLNYAKASDIASLLKDQNTSLLSSRGNVSVDARTNTLLIQDTISSITDVSKLIQQLDVPVKQVLIESRIVDIDTTFEEDLGVRWGITKPEHVTGTITGASAMQQNIIDGNNVMDNIPFAQRLNLNLPAVASDGTQAPSVGVALANLGKGYLLDLELSAIESEGGARVISSPRLVTADQHPAFIQSGQEIPYQVASSSGATAVEFKNAVLSLKVTPQITPDGKIIMDIDVTQDSPDYTNEVLGTPPINTKEIQTSVLVNNGETIVLGGIYTENNEHSVTRVPFLGNLPLVGALFRGTTESNERRELLIFITPKVTQQTPYA